MSYHIPSLREQESSCKHLGCRYLQPQRSAYHHRRQRSQRRQVLGSCHHCKPNIGGQTNGSLCMFITYPRLIFCWKSISDGIQCMLALTYSDRSLVGGLASRSKLGTGLGGLVGGLLSSPDDTADDIGHAAGAVGSKNLDGDKAGALGDTISSRPNCSSAVSSMTVGGSMNNESRVENGLTHCRPRRHRSWAWSCPTWHDPQTRRGGY